MADTQTQQKPSIEEIQAQRKATMLDHAKKVVELLEKPETHDALWGSYDDNLQREVVQLSSGVFGINVIGDRLNKLKGLVVIKEANSHSDGTRPVFAGRCTHIEELPTITVEDSKGQTRTAPITRCEWLPVSFEVATLLVPDR